MTRVSGPGRTSPPVGLMPLNSRSVNRFVLSAEETKQPAPVPPVDVAGLLGLQDEEAPVRRDTSARRDGELALGILAVLQTNLLDGCRFDLEQLRKAVGRMRIPTDPALCSIIGAIRLRVRVELARYERM